MTSAKAPPAKVVRVVERLRHHLYRLQQRMIPPPVAMMELVVGAWVAQAITAAAELGIADTLAKGPLSAEELARKVDADPDALSRLIRALAGKGIFRRRRDGRYELTPLADTLRADAPVSVAGFARFLGSPQHREHWSHLAEAVRTGEAAIPKLRGKPVFEYLADEPAFGAIFNDAMTSISSMAIGPVVAAYDFTRFGTIVDVGGGHGRLLSAILAATPSARGVLYDLPEVVEGAPALLPQHGVADRVRVVGGSFFESVPDGGDAYVLKNIIHDWPDDDAARILRTVRRAARAGATLLLMELVIPQHDRDFVGNWIDLEMLVGVAARERTEAEYRRLFELSGFEMTRIVQTAAPFSVVEGRAI